MSWLLILVPLVPLLAAPAALVVGSRRGEWVGWIPVGATAFSALVLLGLGPRPPLHPALTWFTVGELEFTVSLALDGLSWWVATLVAVIATVVNIYAVRYMARDPARPRFFAWMGFFAGAMLALVLAGSFALLFAAWEGVGLASYALIAHHHHDAAARRAARKAFLVTRLGDMGLLLAWLLALGQTGTTQIDALLGRASGLAPGLALLLALLMLAAAAGKSAQLPLSAWLPDAMAGPTPVSALIHSATLVAAGVYLVLRVYPLFEASPDALTVLRWLGGATAVFAALAATAQHALKRVLAWSTVSQLGEMMLALGLAGPLAATFHLTTHAVFKSALFLCAGAIAYRSGTDDLREMGGLGRGMPYTTAVFAISALALAGVPPFAGFFSADAILEHGVAAHPGWALVLLALLFLAGAYIGRAGFAAFGVHRADLRGGARAAAPAGVPSQAVRIRPAPPTLRWPMVALAAGAVLGGLVLRGPIESVLPFPASAPLGWGWRGMAILASGLGLFVAWRRVDRAGAAPVFGAWPGRLDAALQSLTRWPARGAAALARALLPVEGGIDALGRGAVIGSRGIAFGAEALEAHGFDRAARASGRGVVSLAGGTELAEARAFGEGLDRAAGALGDAGGRLRRLESGKIYLYTASVFVFLLIAGLGGWVLWLTTGRTQAADAAHEASHAQRADLPAPGDGASHPPASGEPAAAGALDRPGHGGGGPGALADPVDRLRRERGGAAVADHRGLDPGAGRGL